MPQEDYSKLLQTIMALSLEQKMTLLSVLEESLQDNMPNPPKITVSTIEELNQKLDEGLEDIN